MTKKFTIAAIFAAVAMASYGGSALLANAQVATGAMTPSQNASLQQQLDNAKAELIQLEMQAGQVPAGDNSLPGATTAPVTVTVTPAAPTTALNSADIAEMDTALTALANMLGTLETRISSNPQFITSNGAAVVSVLQGISNSVASIGTEITGATVAMNNPAIAPTTPTVTSQPSTGSAMAQGSGAANGAAGSAGTSQPSATTQPSQVAQTNPSQTTPPTPAATTNPTPATTNTETASSFSLGKLNWPLIVVIILVVAAIAIWLWWDDSDEKKPVVKSTSPAPQKPIQHQPQTTMNVSATSGSGSASVSASVNRPQPSPSQTPLSSAVSPQGNH